jgi:DNA-binding protein H-NS
METTDQGIQGDMQHLLNMMEANAADLAFLDVPKAKLAAQLAQAQDINKQQDVLTASKQEASKQYRLVVIEGQRLANAIRKMLKSHYGIRSEKLAEFGMQPFRGRARKVKPTPPPQTPATPATPAGTKP